MKIGKLGSSIKILIPVLQELKATEAATSLNLLMSLFEELKDEEVEEFTKAATHLDVEPRHNGLLLGDIAKSLFAIVAFAKASGATAPRVATLKAALACVDILSLANIAFSDFAQAIKASLKVDIVALYLNALEANLGTPSFDAVFNALKSDRRVRQPEVIAIATHFVSKTSKSAKKAPTLSRIYARHASLIDSANKREWQKGKSAA